MTTSKNQINDIINDLDSVTIQLQEFKLKRSRQNIDEMRQLMNSMFELSKLRNNEVISTITYYSYKLKTKYGERIFQLQLEYEKNWMARLNQIEKEEFDEESEAQRENYQQLEGGNQQNIQQMNQQQIQLQQQSQSLRTFIIHPPKSSTVNHRRNYTNTRFSQNQNPLRLSSCSNYNNNKPQNMVQVKSQQQQQQIQFQETNYQYNAGYKTEKQIPKVQQIQKNFSTENNLFNKLKIIKLTQSRCNSAFLRPHMNLQSTSQLQSQNQNKLQQQMLEETGEQQQQHYFEQEEAQEEEEKQPSSEDQIQQTQTTQQEEQLQQQQQQMQQYYQTNGINMANLDLLTQCQTQEDAPLVTMTAEEEEILHQDDRLGGLSSSPSTNKSKKNHNICNNNIEQFNLINIEQDNDKFKTLLQKKLDTMNMGGDQKFNEQNTFKITRNNAMPSLSQQIQQQTKINSNNIMTPNQNYFSNYQAHALASNNNNNIQLQQLLLLQQQQQQTQFLSNSTNLNSANYINQIQLQKQQMSSPRPIQNILPQQNNAITWHQYLFETDSNKAKGKTSQEVFKNIYNRLKQQKSSTASGNQQKQLIQPQSHQIQPQSQTYYSQQQHQQMYQQLQQLQLMQLQQQQQLIQQQNSQQQQLQSSQKKAQTTMAQLISLNQNNINILRNISATELRNLKVEGCNLNQDGNNSNNSNNNNTKLLKLQI